MKKVSFEKEYNWKTHNARSSLSNLNQIIKYETQQTKCKVRVVIIWREWIAIFWNLFSAPLKQQSAKIIMCLHLEIYTLMYWSEKKIESRKGDLQNLNIILGSIIIWGLIGLKLNFDCFIDIAKKIKIVGKFHKKKKSWFNGPRLTKFYVS